ncbi:hypothetical protein J6590_097794 [Homalodisca vitripennis]|nr:hypothetical protein J6590_097794 [Homalodisca vitripennis]
MSNIEGHLVERDSEIDRLLNHESDEDFDDDGYDNDFAQAEFEVLDFGQNSDDDIENRLGENIVVQNEFNDVERGGGDADLNVGLDLPGFSSGSEMVWEHLFNYNPVREEFVVDSGPKINPVSILNTFLFFFDDKLVDNIVLETNKYADAEMAKQGMIFRQHSRLWKWTPCTKK